MKICLVLSMVIVCNLTMGAEPVSADVRLLESAAKLTKDDPSGSLRLLAEYSKAPNWDAQAIRVAELSASALLGLGKNEEALKWCIWGIGRAKYLGVPAGELQRLRQEAQKRIADALEKDRAKELGEDTMLFDAARRLEREHAFGPALEKYSDLIKRFPQSKHVAMSRLHVGWCLLWLWRSKECLVHMLAFVESDPPVALRAEGHLLLGDLYLMALCNGKQALCSYDRARSVIEGGGAETADMQWRLDQRLGVVQYVMGDMQAAARSLEAAERAMPAEARGDERNLYGIKAIRGFIQDKWSPTPEWVHREGSVNTRIALSLGDLWYEMLDFDRARATYELALSASGLKAEATPNQEAYAKLQIGLCHETKFETGRAEALYREILTKCPKAPSAPTAMLRLGCMLFNQTARHKEASEMLLALQKKYSGFAQADYALYVAGWMNAWDGRFDEAKSILAYMKTVYPGSNRWVQTLRGDIERRQAADSARSIGASGSRN